ncbi:MAG TPA: hypothetical protein VLW83_06830 [Candidatus Acidoferrales bacterium]|nr:hypothetical protein [Candidatus Acidoferrales bacterium]
MATILNPKKNAVILRAEGPKDLNVQRKQVRHKRRRAFTRNFEGPPYPTLCQGTASAVP